MKKLCVFCSSSNNLDEKYFKAAADLGKEIVKNNYGLVYGGSNLGLMRELAKTVRAGGMEVLGVLPSRMKSRKPDKTLVSRLIFCRDLRQRKKIMEKNSEAALVLPGGFGTLDEIFELIALKQLGFYNKPLIFLNIEGFYDKLFSFIEQFYSEGFASINKSKLYRTVSTSDEIFTLLKDK